jgi:hypothetical protein
VRCDAMGRLQQRQAGVANSFRGSVRVLQKMEYDPNAQSVGLGYAVKGGPAGWAVGVRASTWAVGPLHALMGRRSDATEESRQEDEL